MDLFIEGYTISPIKIISKQESPDFIVACDGKRVGIEITEVFQDSDKGLSKLQQYSSDASTFTDELISKIQPHIEFTFSIGINFSKQFPLKKSTKSDVLQKVQEICVLEMINLLNHQHIELDNYWHKLPIEIDDIHIYRYDEMGESINSKPEGGAVGNLNLSHIKPILAKKEKKLPNYLDCDSQWLLIREGNYYAGTFSDIQLNIPIESLFDKVYLLRTSKRDLVQLK